MHRHVTNASMQVQTQAAQKQIRTKRERQASEREKTRQRAFMAFRESMSPDQQEAFETVALENPEHLTRRLYIQHSARRDKTFELYRKIILQSHFLVLRGISWQRVELTGDFAWRESCSER
jgi:hypothetical protein